MKKKGTWFFIAFLPIAAISVQSCAQSEVKKVDNNSNEKRNESPEYQENVDIWFGPGFYYGIWFANEQDYWRWRGYHRDYPSNHKYYNRDRPVEYHHNEDMDEDRGGPGGRGGEGGGHGEGGGGGHGGGHGGR